jgi:precorrin-8X/cobalt-precorrin-8 methylmutase
MHAAWWMSSMTSSFRKALGKAGRDALLAGAPILCDARMVAEGITRSRLPANNEVICTLNDPSVPELANEDRQYPLGCSARPLAPASRQQHCCNRECTDRPFPPVRIAGCNGAPKPALIIGMPVGFVGAAESKDELATNSRGVPYVIVRGRRGGSAMTAAAVNALASERE